MERASDPPPDAAETLPKPWRRARAALEFTVEQVAGGLTGLKALDALLVLAVNQANIAPLTRDAGARTAYGSLAAPAPDLSRRPVSIHAINTSLQLPFETVRRRIHHLETLGIVRHEGRGVIIPASYLSSPAYLQDVVAAHGRLRDLYFALTRADLLEPLPPSAYAPEDEPPMRAAARLLSDFLLRSADVLMRRTHDIVSGLILGAVACASLPGARMASPKGPGMTATEAGKWLGLPGETARRRMMQLTADGHCVRGADGLYNANLEADPERWEAAMAELAAVLQRLMAGLAERGVVEAWLNPALAAQRNLAS